MNPSNSCYVKYDVEPDLTRSTEALSHSLHKITIVDLFCEQTIKRKEILDPPYAVSLALAVTLASSYTGLRHAGVFQELSQLTHGIP